MITSSKLDSGAIRVSGISCGSSAALVAYCELSIIEAFTFGLMWQKVFDSRWLRYWFVSAQLIERNVHHLFVNQCGFNYDKLKKLAEKRGDDALIFGVTTINLKSLSLSNLLGIGKKGSKQLQHGQQNKLSDDDNDNQENTNSNSLFNFKCISDFSSISEMISAAICSCRTLPFFSSLGYLRGEYCFDGGFSSLYAIPSNALDDNVVRVNVSDFDNNAHIRPRQASHRFKISEYVDSGTLDDNLRRFAIGYESAANRIAVNECMATGLKMHEAIEKDVFSDELKWQQFTSERIDYWKKHVSAHFNAKKKNKNDIIMS